MLTKKDLIHLKTWGQTVSLHAGKDWKKEDAELYLKLEVMIKNIGHKTFKQRQDLLTPYKTTI